MTHGTTLYLKDSPIYSKSKINFEKIKFKENEAVFM